MRRPFVLATAVAAALVLVGAAAAAPLFVLTGRGWGHGIGMSQYGAYGYALHGSSYGQILAHYYPGTGLGTRSKAVEVLLASSRSSVTIGSAANFKAGTAQIGAGTWKVTVALDGRLKLVKGAVTRKFSSPTTFKPGTAALALGGNHYRGSIVLRASNKLVWALNVLGLDPYVKGVVPQEMPPSWHLAALKAQAVAARTYALAAGGHCSWFTRSVMCPDTRDQVYGGKDAEEVSTNRAVDETARKVLLHGGAPASTFFFSTSGGKTAAKHHEWGGAPVPYLVSVADPHEAFSPHHRWGPDALDDCSGSARDCVYSAADMGRLLGVTGLRDMTVVRNASSRVAQVNLSRASGPASVDGSDVRFRLGLRSTWFFIGVLRLTPSAHVIEWGKGASLAALTRGVANVTLQRRPHAGAWGNLRGVSGSLTVAIAPRITTWFRLSSPSATGSLARVAVRPKLRFGQDQSPGSLTGTMGPKLAGATVAVQRRRVDGTWKKVGTATVNASGVWKATFNVTSGTYRAYSAPGNGYVPGTSPTRVF
ncbi:MAG: SpoIID/LytB domain-containing protein [Gaiellaceae bacterium]